MTGEWTVKGEKPNDETVERSADSRSEAEEVKKQAEDDGLLDNIEIVPPNNPEAKTDGGGEVVAETVDDSEELDLADPTDGPHPPDQKDTDDPLAELGEELGTDPLSILPGHMVDKIGRHDTPAINKRGYAMIAERYGISASATIEVYPWENEEGRCVAKSIATTDDGKEYSGWATARDDDGDMEDQIIELAETRALKRSVSWASGVGIVSYQELSNQLEGGQ